MRVTQRSLWTRTRLRLPSTSTTGARPAAGVDVQNLMSFNESTSHPVVLGRVKNIVWKIHLKHPNTHAIVTTTRFFRSFIWTDSLTDVPPAFRVDHFVDETKHQSRSYLLDVRQM